MLPTNDTSIIELLCRLAECYNVNTFVILPIYQKTQHKQTITVSTSSVSVSTTTVDYFKLPRIKRLMTTVARFSLYSYNGISGTLDFIFGKVQLFSYSSSSDITELLGVFLMNSSDTFVYGTGILCTLLVAKCTEKQLSNMTIIDTSDASRSTRLTGILNNDIHLVVGLYSLLVSDYGCPIGLVGRQQQICYCHSDSGLMYCNNYIKVLESDNKEQKCIHRKVFNYCFEFHTR